MKEQTIYVPTPISQKPEKTITVIFIKEGVSATCFNSVYAVPDSPVNEIWQNKEGVTHWLRPTTLLEELSANSIKSEADSHFEMNRLYDWIMNDKRRSATTFFTSGSLRNCAKEIEFMLAAKDKEIEKRDKEIERLKNLNEDSFKAGISYEKKRWAVGDSDAIDFNSFKSENNI